MMLYSKILN